MLGLKSHMNFYLCQGAVDMRKGIFFVYLTHARARYYKHINLPVTVKG